MTAVLTLSVILFGILAYIQLPVNDLPAVDYPVIQVTVGYPGASPDTIANNIATPLERQFMQINGLELVTSQSTQGVATFTLQFALEKNIDAAATDERMVRHDELDAGVNGDGGAGFRDHAAVDGDLPRENQRAGALARRREAPIDHQHVETCPQRHGVYRASWCDPRPTRRSARASG